MWGGRGGGGGVGGVINSNTYELIIGIIINEIKK